MRVDWSLRRCRKIWFHVDLLFLYRSGSWRRKCGNNLTVIYRRLATRSDIVNGGFRHCGRGIQVSNGVKRILESRDWCELNWKFPTVLRGAKVK